MLCARYPTLTVTLQGLSSSTGFHTLLLMFQVAGHPYCQPRLPLSMTTLLPQGDGESMASLCARVLQHCYLMYCAGHIPGVYHVFEMTFGLIHPQIWCHLQEAYQRVFLHVDRFRTRPDTLPAKFWPEHLGNTFVQFCELSQCAHSYQASSPPGGGTGLLVPQPLAAPVSSRPSPARVREALRLDRLSRIRGHFQRQPPVESAELILQYISR